MMPPTFARPSFASAPSTAAAPRFWGGSTWDKPSSHRGSSSSTRRRICAARSTTSRVPRCTDMPASLIRWSIQNPFFVLMATVLLAARGIHATISTPLDALPDLSDTQVIIRTEFPGQAPQVVEDQVTYPLTTTMLSVPGARTVRGYSFFGDSFVYVIFDDKTDLYWARSRVLEYLSQVRSSLPNGVNPALGPDATGI